MREGSLALRFGSLRPPFEILLAAAVLVTHLFAAFAPLDSLLYWYPTDDAFYYFQVARHIAAGDGVTFDGFNPANGFHPLWMLICLPVFSLAAVDKVLPLRILILVMALLNAATAVLLYRMLKGSIHGLAAALIAVVWAFTPAIHAVTTLRGMESGIGALTLVGLLSLLARQEKLGWQGLGWKDHAWLGLAASAVVFSRLDNVFIAAVIGVWVMFRRGGANGYILTWILASVVTIFCAYFLRLGFVPEYPEFLPGLIVFLSITLLVRLPVFFLAGLHLRPGAENLLRDFLRSMTAGGVSIVVGGVVALLFSSAGWVGNFPRAVIAIEGGLFLVLLIVIRVVARLLDCSQANPPREYGLAGLRRCLPTWLATGAAYALPLVILLLAYVIWNQVNFGTFMPVSGQIKHWWGQSGDTIYGRPVKTFPALFGLQFTGTGPWTLLLMPFDQILISVKENLPWMPAALGGICYLAVSALVRRRLSPALNKMIGLLFTASLIQVLYYNGTYYVNLRPWYWVNQMLLIALIWAVLVDAVFRRIVDLRYGKGVLRPAVVVMMLAMIGGYTVYQFRLVPLSTDARSTYPDLAEARTLETLTEPGSRIGMTGGGVVAYFIDDRTIVNLDGLMNSPAYFSAVKAGKGQEVADRFDLDYVFGGAYILLHSNPYYFTLQDRLVPLTNLGGGVVFQYRKPEMIEGEIK